MLLICGWFKTYVLGGFNGDYEILAEPGDGPRLPHPRGLGADLKAGRVCMKKVLFTVLAGVLAGMTIAPALADEPQH